MAENRHLNDEYSEIAQALIDSEDVLEYIRESQVSIVYLSSDLKKMDNGRIVHAQCEKVADKYKWGIPADYMITVYEPNVLGFTDEQMKILLFHELLHIHIEYQDGEEKYTTNPHDLEDFKYIIDRFGTDWSRVTGEEKTDFSFGIAIDIDGQIKQNLDHLNM